MIGHASRATRCALRSVTGTGDISCKRKQAANLIDTIGWLAVKRDGAHSLVRHTLPGRFVGVAAEVSFIVDDAKPDGSFTATYAEPWTETSVEANY